MSAEKQDHHLAELDRLRSDVAALTAERQRLVDTLLLAERDRQVFGYELHDGILQNLTAACLLLEGGLAQTTFATPAQQESYTRAIELIRSGIVEMRRLVGGLAAVELADVTLGEALERLAERYRAQYGLDVSFAGSAERLDLPPATRYLLLRIAQEAVNNAWKHAPASRVLVRLDQGAGRLRLSIEDGGPGFDPLENKPGHFGLDGMRARAHLLGAEMQIDSGAGQGTRIGVSLPHPQTARMEENVR
jgi:signal transduction histidine kinase